MLFRILYGESEFINKKMLYIDNNILSKNDLINYSSPTVEAKDIYDQILYNFDKKAVMANLNLAGSFGIRGVAAVGKNINIKIENISSSLNIIRENGKIYLRGTITGGNFTENVNVVIYSEYTEEKNYIIQSWGRGAPVPSAPSSPNNNTSIVFIGDCNIPNRKTYGLIAAGDLGFPVSAGSFGPTVQLSITNPSWEGTSGDESYGRLGECCCGFAPCASTCGVSTETKIERIIALQNICSTKAYGSVTMSPPLTENISYCPDDPTVTPGLGPCSSYDVGYCRKKSCSSCVETTDSIDEKNFSYDFEQCRTKFTLFGHAYKQSLKDLPRTRIIPRQNVPVTISLVEIENAIKNNALSGIETRYNQFGEPIGCIALYGPVEPCGDDACVTGSCDFPNSLLYSDPPCVFPSENPPCSYCWTGTFFDDISNSSTFMINGKNICTEHSEYCGVSVGGDREVLTYRKIYLQTIQNSLSSYNPLCPTSLITVSYTSNSITFNIGGETFCIPSSFSSCPTITVDSTMSQLSVSDTISSSCDKCSPNAANISLENQSQSFLTVREKRKCIVGIRYVNTVNPVGLVSWGRRNYYSSSSWSHQCGGGSIEYGCLEFGQDLLQSPDLFVGISVTCNIPLPGDIPASVAAYEIPEWVWELNQIYKSRYAYLGAGSSHIPEADIIEGIVPGTVTDIKLESFSMGGSKRDRLGVIGGDVLTAHVAYYEYDYIRPVTITNILRNDSGIVCTSNSYDGGVPVRDLRSILSDSRASLCPAIPFPPNYVSNFSGSSAGNFLYNSRGSVGGSSYTITNPGFKKDSNCSSSVSCYYKHNVFICPDNPCCLSDLNVSRNVGAQPEGGNVLSTAASKQTCTMSDSFPRQY
jgi:hypothetical protein